MPWLGFLIDAWVSGLLVMEIIFHVQDRRIQGHWDFRDERLKFLISAFWPITVLNMNWHQIFFDITIRR